MLDILEAKVLGKRKVLDTWRPCQVFKLHLSCEYKDLRMRTFGKFLNQLLAS